MANLDVLELATKIQADSITGALTEQLLSEGNDLYELADAPNRLFRISPNGEISIGFLKANTFTIEKPITHK